MIAGLFKQLIIILCLAAVVGCTTPKSYTTSYIKILEKGITDRQYWVMATDPYAKESKKFKIFVDNENTWFLIEEGKEYLASYDYISLDKRVDLSSIKHPAKPK